MNPVDLWRVTLFGIFFLVQCGAQSFRSAPRKVNGRSTCLVLAPHVFHLDEEEKVWVTIPTSPHGQVNVDLTFDDGRRRFGRVQRTIGSSDESKQIGITLRNRDISRRNGNSRLYLVANCNGREATRTAVKISESKKTVLIQTDKPIYTPKQKVLTRVYTLDRNLLPTNFQFYVDIVNPQGVVVQRDSNPPGPDDDVNKNNIPGMFHTSFQFPPFPMFGDWQVVVSYGRNYGLKEKVVFVVEKYDLPQFSVDLDVDIDVIFPTSLDLGLDIKARYIFGGEIHGSAFCKFGIINRNREIMFRSVSIKNFSGSGRNVVIDMSWVKDMIWFPKIEGSRLLIECNVTDSNSLKIVTAVNKKTIFSRSPYVVDFENSQGYFKPNLPYFLQADVKHLNGLATPEGMRVTFSLADRQGRYIAGTTTHTRTNARGGIGVNLDMKAQAGGRMIKVTVDGFGDRSFNHELKRDSNNADRFISVVPKNTRMPLQEGQIIQLAVHVSHPKEVKTLHYAIISKGIIHHHGTSRVQQGTTLSIHVTREYVPVLSVMVFYSSAAAGLVSDTISLQVEYDCDTRDMFSMNKNKYAPAEKMTVTVSGPPQTHFALMAVDQAVYLLRNRSRLTADKMLRAITRNIVKQNKVSSSQNAMAQTSVGVFGRSRLMIARQAGRPMRGMQRRPRGKMARRRVTRDAESGDEEIGRESYDDEYYNYDYYPYEYEMYESGEERLEDSSSLLLAESKIQETADDVIEMTLQQCCEKAKNESSTNCKAAAVNLTDLDVSPECIHTFYNCCLREYAEKHAGQQEDGDDNYKIHVETIRITESEEKDIFEISSARKNGVVRRYFPESWMFDVYTIGPHSGSRQMQYTVPDSITKWDLQAVTLHHITGLCVLQPRTIKVSKDIFMIVDMPYEAVRTEQLEIKVTIHNNYGKKITVDVYMVGVPGICTDTIPGNRSKKTTISIAKGKQDHTSWAIKPVKVGKHDPRFELHAREFDQHSDDMTLVDTVIKPLNVIPEGVERIRTVGSYILDPQKIVSSSSSIKAGLQRETVRLMTPADAIPGSVEAVVKINGDIMGPAVQTVSGDLVKLLRQPIASGEQTMMNLGPVLYTAKYLKRTDQLSVKTRRKARRRIKMGVQHMLTFRKSDGSFSIWARANASTWLTAYVIKVFSDSQEFGSLSGDPSKILCSASRWLARQQESDGSFSEISPFSTRQVMTKGDVEGKVALTAFAVVSLESVDCGNRAAIQKALTYLQQKLSHLRFKPYPLSIVTYAFSVSKYGSQYQSGDLLWNANIMRCYDNSRCYWPADRSDLTKPAWYKKPKALEVETASYALLAYIEQKNFVKAKKIAKWLVQQRNDKGAFISTQDTMLALEALSLFSTRTRIRDIDLEVVLSATKNPKYRKNIYIDSQNSLSQQHIQVTNHVDGELFLTSRGNGVGQAHIHLKYHSLNDDDDNQCKFYLNVKAEEKTRTLEELLGGGDRRRRSMRRRGYTHRRSRRLASSSSYVLELTICMRYKDIQPTGLAMLQVGLFTGFEAIESQLKNLKRNANNNIGRYEAHNRAIHFFMDRVHNRETCLKFDVRQKQKVGNTQPVAVTVYDMNEPSARCTKFYHPHMNGELRKIICRNNGECTCRD